MYRVLLVDDEQNIRNGLEILIDWNKLGFNEVSTAEDGIEALSKIKEKNYHLVITDIRMPGMNGLELVHKIRENNDNVKIIILSGYNEFSYAKEAIRYGVEEYILKPVAKDELETLVLKIKQAIDKEFQILINISKKNNLIHDKLLWDIANGKYLTVQEAISSSSYEIELNATYYCIYIIYIEKIRKILKDNQVEAKLILFYVRNILEEFVQQNNAYIYEEEDMQFGILAYSKDYNSLDSGVTEQLRKAQRYIKEVFAQEISIACGNVVKNFYEVQQSKKQALYALSNKHLFSKGQLIIYDYVVLDNSKKESITWDVVPLLSAIEEMSIDAIVNQVKLLTAEIIEKKVNKNTIDGIVTFILNVLKKLLIKHNGDYNIITSDIEITKKEDFALLEDRIIEMCIGTGRYISKISRKAYPSSMDEITKYIDEHYNEDLSLKTIASKFYMNPAYLGRMLKSNNNLSFNEYLNNRRISHVKKLYATTNLKINEILDKVGYNSSDYFYRVFKKQEGITFSEYCEKVKLNLFNS